MIRGVPEKFDNDVPADVRLGSPSPPLKGSMDTASSVNRRASAVAPAAPSRITW